MKLNLLHRWRRWRRTRELERILRRAKFGHLLVFLHELEHGDDPDVYLAGLEDCARDIVRGTQALSDTAEPGP